MDDNTKPSSMEWPLISLLLIVMAVVFWQIYTDMTQAGIASGGPIDNAASYPRAVTVILGLLVGSRVIKIGRTLTDRKSKERMGSLSAMKGPTTLLLSFLLYLIGLKYLGYYLVTTPFLVATVYLNGERKWVRILIFGVVVSFLVAFVFEALLNVVLPGGIFRIHISWF